MLDRRLVVGYGSCRCYDDVPQLSFYLGTALSYQLRVIVVVLGLDSACNLGRGRGREGWGEGGREGERERGREDERDGCGEMVKG